MALPLAPLGACSSHRLQAGILDIRRIPGWAGIRAATEDIRQGDNLPDSQSVVDILRAGDRPALHRDPVAHPARRTLDNHRDSRLEGIPSRELLGDRCHWETEQVGHCAARELLRVLCAARVRAWAAERGRGKDCCPVRMK